MDSDALYVEVDLEGIVETEWLSRIGDKCKLIGLDTDTPILQLGPYSFEGNYVETIGTSLFFEDKRSQDGKGEAEFRCHTHKRLQMKRCFLKKNEQTEATESEAVTTSVQDESKQSSSAFQEHNMLTFEQTSDSAQYTETPNTLKHEEQTLNQDIGIVTATSLSEIEVQIETTGIQPD